MIDKYLAPFERILVVVKSALYESSFHLNVSEIDQSIVNLICFESLKDVRQHQL